MDDRDENPFIGCLFWGILFFVAIVGGLIYSNIEAKKILQNKKYDAILFGKGEIVEIYSQKEFAIQSKKGEREIVKLEDFSDKVVVKGDWWTIKAIAFDPESPSSVCFTLDEKVEK